MNLKKIGWVSLIGRPNVGKSSLMNRLIGYDLSIISDVPQATRDRILGVYTNDEYQLIFMDTPGIHKPHSKFGELLNKKAYDTLDESDVVLFLQPINEDISIGDEFILEKIKNKKNKIAVITKLDLANSEVAIQNKVKELKKRNFSVVVGTSEKISESILVLLEELKKFTYEDNQLYEDDFITDKSELFLVKEIIRFNAMNNLRDELPHSIAIEINNYIQEGNKRIISANILCKKDSQKGIIIGKNGLMIKKIGTSARKEINKKFGFSVFLDLNVKTRKNWINDEKEIKNIGY